MLVLFCSTVVRSSRRSHIIAIFGVGLIGLPIVNWLKLRSGCYVHALPFSWNDGNRQEIECSDIARYITECIKGSSSYDGAFLNTKVSIVWAAGKGGFGATAEALEPELASFRCVVDMAASLREELLNSDHGFHMLSSAGGLFEGQRNVHPATVCRPIRPYAMLKERQEEYAVERIGGVSLSIYRPSSVYGYNRHGSRMGLVPTLLENGIQRRVSRVFVDMNTLRDYVLAEDVADFIGRKIVEGHWGEDEVAIFTLASGRASSVFEVKRHIERLLGRRIYVQYQPGPVELEHNTYNRTALPDGWRAMDLETGIRFVHSRIYANLAQERR
jgi:UDP-glucose 4-epimerase